VFSIHCCLTKHKTGGGDLQGTHALVEFASRESIASLHETVAVPVPQNESVVPFKSRLLSLRNVAAAAVGTKRQPEPQRKPQGTIPINELIKRLSKEMTVSVIRDVAQMLLV